MLDMKKFNDVIVLSLLIVWLPTIHSDVNSAHNVLNPDRIYEQFALDLLVETSCLLKSEHNVVLSPFSVWSVLMPAMEGASGQTLSQLKAALHINTDQLSVQKTFKQIHQYLQINTSSSVELESVNSMFTDIQQPIQKKFKSIVEDVYKTRIYPISFQKVNMAVKNINGWVSNVTHNRITHLVNKDDLTDLNLILANAIYFKGPWKYPFNVTDTFEDEFKDEGGNSLGKVQMMMQTGPFMYSFVPEIEAHLLVLPYQGDQFSMLLALPQEEVPLLQVLERIKLISLKMIYKQVEQTQGIEIDEVRVFLPRFVIKSDFVLNAALQNLGIKDAFTAAADFSLMSEHNPYLSKVIHKAEIEVAEEGTAASSVTGGMYINKMMPATFYANRPFAYFIIENEHKTVLFAGRVTNAAKT